MDGQPGRLCHRFRNRLDIHDGCNAGNDRGYMEHLLHQSADHFLEPRPVKNIHEADGLHARDRITLIGSGSLEPDADPC